MYTTCEYINKRSEEDGDEKKREQSTQKKRAEFVASSLGLFADGSGWDHVGF